jgi:hypothetical protein
MPPARAINPAAPLDLENPEQEIARLTWTVLDGSALAELVNAQHSRRRRVDP